MILRNRSQTERHSLQEQGFALIWLVIWLPVLVLFLSGIIFAQAWIISKERSLHVCRTTLLQDLPYVGLGIEKLLKLNNLVRSLRKIRSSLEKSYKSLSLVVYLPGVPATMALIQQALVVTISTQNSVRTLQNSIIGSTNILLEGLLRRAELMVQRELNHTRSQMRTSFNFLGHIHFQRAPPMAVRAEVSSDPGPPTYVLVNNFSSAQALHVSWTYSLKNKFYRSPEARWKLPNLFQDNGCSATLKEGKVHLTPVLFKDRYSLK